MSVLGVYNSSSLEIDHGDGVYLYANDGTRYLDFTSGIGVSCLGYSHPGLISALKEQSEKIWHCSNLFTISQQKTVAKRIVENSFASSVFFCNSGAESVEAGIKVVRKFFHHDKKNKYKIICAKNSFHGRTFGAISASGKSMLTEGFDPILDGFVQVEFNNTKEIIDNLDKNTAAIMIETVMGEGGIKVIPNWCVKAIRKICNQRGVLLILDEVQCGIGRSGKFFAFEYSKVKPDIVPIAKGIGGGFPIGAVLMTKKVSKAMVPGTHGSTFGGNPLAMAVGNAVLDQINNNLLNNVKKMSKYFISNLIKLKTRYPNIIKEVRGVGLLIGIQLFSDQTFFIKRLMENKLLTIRAAENVIRILPPLNVKKNEIDLALRIINKVCKEVN